MAAKVNWQRYGTKLRHCRPVYLTMSQYLFLPRLDLAVQLGDVVEERKVLGFLLQEARDDFVNVV